MLNLYPGPAGSWELLFDDAHFQLLPVGRRGAQREPPELPGEVRQTAVAQLPGNAPDIEPGCFSEVWKVFF